jgi:DNA recombination protein RmuC
MELLNYIILALIAINLILQFYFRSTKNNDVDLSSKLDVFSSSLTRIENNLKDDFRNNRDESTKLAKENRDELNNTLKEFKKELGETLKNKETVE